MNRPRINTLIAALIMACTLGVGSVQAQTVQLSLKEALNFALKNNASVRKARLEAEKGKELTAEVRSQALPQITASGSLNDNLMIQKSPLPGEILGRPGETILVAFGQKYTANANVQLSQQLFNQSVFTGLKAARAGEEYYQLNVDLSEENVLQMVSSAYYQVLVSREKIEAIDANISSLQRTEKILSDQYKNGLATRIDVDRVKVSLTNLQTQRDELAKAAVQQENTLKYYIGMPIGVSVELPEAELNQIVEGANSLADTVNVSGLTEYALLKKQEELLIYQKKSKVAEYYPKLSFITNYSQNGFSNKFDLFKSNGTANWAEASAIGLNISIPIFDGFGRRSRVRQAQIEIEQISEDLKDNRQALNLAYSNARLQLRTSVSTIRNQNENMRLAREVFSSTQNNYNNGLASLTDLLNAETALTDAQNSYTQALLNYKLAEIQLMKSNGNIKSLLN
ncbi:outer membrane protein TolC [Arcticibacter pallidicorallinus]|uniref:Outer membrane protein TolC n=1 Tax=Arcticibacter pallidicorallinus TaxID=1259464 RepID=A0A2T0TWI8_9SPHI|nr:TolC family protein [Arcticibacter pallidicorallinus]PRY49878.1 outer membrane protein TolC [Arcticibacter pallidicorallinus]